MKTMQLAMVVALSMLLTNGLVYAANPLTLKQDQPTTQQTVKKPVQTQQVSQTKKSSVTVKVIAINLKKTNPSMKSKTSETWFLISAPKTQDTSKKALLTDNKGSKWRAVTLIDLKKLDTNKDKKLTANEAAKGKISIATVTPGGLNVTTLSDQKISEIQFTNGKKGKAGDILFKNSEGTLKGKMTTIRLQAPLASSVPQKKSF